jgi:hypothetical protein
MPQAAVYLIDNSISAVVFSLANKSGRQGDHPFTGNAFLQNELVISHTGIVLPHLYNAVEDKLSVISAIQGQIILFQLFWQW